MAYIPIRIEKPKSKAELKLKLAKDLRFAGQAEMADFIMQSQSAEMENLIETALEGKHYLVFCKSCGKVFVDLPFREFYKKHTHPEWDLWFCDAVIHWAENPAHSIYCFSDQRNYDISSSLAVDCRGSDLANVKRDVVVHRKTLEAKKGKI